MAINSRTRRRRLNLPRSWPGDRPIPSLDGLKRGVRRRNPGSETSSKQRVAESPVERGPAPEAAAPVTLDAMIDRFTQSWDRGEPVRAEDYVGLFAPSDAAELVYHEYCLAEAADLDPDPADYLRRFPDYSDALGRLFSLHGALSVSTLQRMAAPAGLPEAGDAIGPYRLLRELGRGAFARVFLAEQSDLGDRLVVVKVSTRPSSEPMLLARARHANIVEVLRHVDADDGALHLVCLPFLGGATLGAILQARRDRPKPGRTKARPPRSGRDFLDELDRASAPEHPSNSSHRPAREVMARLSYPRALAWMAARLAEALDHAERRGVTHGDIKPSNILITADGTPMLFDFNLAVDWHDADAANLGGGSGGTLAYMAPERLLAIADPEKTVDDRQTSRRRQPDRHRADLYALGLVLAEALTGEPPTTFDRQGSHLRSFAAGLALLRGGPVESQPALKSRGIPPTLRAILARCLAPDPVDRYARGGELAEDLDRWRSDRPLVYAPEPTRSSWLRQARRFRYPILAAGLTLAAALAVGVGASVVIRGTNRDQAMAKWSYILDGSEGVFKLRRFGRWKPESMVESADLASRHLAHYDVVDDPRWRSRDDIRFLPDRERGELEAWVIEQIFRRAVALSERSDPKDWQRASISLDQAIAQTPIAALRTLRSTLRDRLGSTSSNSLPTSSEPSTPPPAWLESYLAGVAAEPLHARQALGYYLDALRNRPDMFWAHYRASVVACRIDEYPTANRHLQECVVRRPKNRWLLTQHGGLLLKLEQDAICGSSLSTLRDAEVECNRALSLDPDFAEAHFTRTLIRQALGQTESVSADIDRFSTLTRSTNPAESLGLRFSSRLGYGPNLVQHTKADEAILRQAIIEDPSNELHRMQLASGLEMSNRSAEAIDQYDQVLDSNPTHLRARYERAVQNRHNDYTGTIAEFATLIEHPLFEETFREQPDMIRVYHHVATDLMKRGKLAEAEAVAQRSLTAINQSSSLRDLSKKIRYGEVLELAPQAETYYLLARINAVAAKTDSSRLSTAVRYLRDAFSIQPTLRANWFAIDSFFEANRVNILDHLDRAVDQ